MHTGTITAVSKACPVQVSDKAMEGQRRYLETIKRAGEDGLTLRIPIMGNCDRALVEEILGSEAVNTFCRGNLPPAAPKSPQPPQAVRKPRAVTSAFRTETPQPPQDALLPEALRKPEMRIRGVCLTSAFDMKAGSPTTVALNGVSFDGEIPLRVRHFESFDCGRCTNFCRVGNTIQFEAVIRGDTEEGIFAQEKIQSGEYRHVSAGLKVDRNCIVRLSPFERREYGDQIIDGGDDGNTVFERSHLYEVSLTDAPADRSCWIKINH
jgi:hypothetical protein